MPVVHHLVLLLRFPLVIAITITCTQAPVNDKAVTRLERKTKTEGEGGRPVSRLACAKALALVANDEAAAHMYLVTHVERLEDEAARESAAAARRAGLFKNDATLINLQARRSSSVLSNTSHVHQTVAMFAFTNAQCQRSLPLSRPVNALVLVSRRRSRPRCSRMRKR